MITGAAYSLEMGHKIRPGLVCAGQFTDGPAQVAVVTAADTVLLHSLQPRQEAIPLKTGLPVRSIAALRYPGADTDHLAICTKTSVLVYDVHNNRDVFRHETIDGGNVVMYAELNVPTIVVGGNCSVQGYTETGEESFWAVTGDNVRSLTTVDIDKDGHEELVVGSEDYDIRIFKQDDLIHEITETQIVTHLLSLGQGMFAYALANGTVGVYEYYNRLWRVKSKHRAVQITIYDVNNDGIVELLTGWQGGKVDGRNVRTGEVLFKDNLKNSVAGVAVIPDRNHLVAVSISGETRVYSSSAPKVVSEGGVRMHVEQDVIRELFVRKQSLIVELNNYHTNDKYRHQQHADDPTDPAAAALIPARTRLQTSLDVHPGGEGEVAHVQVSMATNNETCIRAVLVFAEGMFKGETQVKHPRLRDVTTSLSVALFPPRDIPIDIHIKALVGYPDSPQLHVFELTRQLPRFSMYALLEGKEPQTNSHVEMILEERVQRVVLWLNRHFLLNVTASSDLNLPLVCLRDSLHIVLTMDASGQVVIKTDNMTLAGDLIQSLAQYLNIQHLQSIAEFPAEEKRCEELLTNIQQLDNVKRKLNMELGSKTNMIRNLITRAEDARLLGEYQLMRRLYQQLQEVNKELQVGQNIRSSSYADSVATVRELHNIVQRASRLRVGKYKTDPVTLAKKAIADNNPASLIQAIRRGEA